MEIINDNSLADYTIKLFKELMAVTDYASLSETDRIAYDAKLKVARDNASCLSFARKYGIEEGKLDVAKVVGNEMPLITCKPAACRPGWRKDGHHPSTMDHPF